MYARLYSLPVFKDIHQPDSNANIHHIRLIETNIDKERRGKRREREKGNIMKTRQGKATQGKTRQDKTRQCKMRRENEREKDRERERGRHIDDSKN